MGYPRGVRHGHAGGHLRKPVLELVESMYADKLGGYAGAWWSPFESPEEAYDHLGRLSHCTDIVPGSTRSMMMEMVDEEHEPVTYAVLVRQLRPVIAGRIVDRDQTLAEAEALLRRP